MKKSMIESLSILSAELIRHGFSQRALNHAYDAGILNTRSKRAKSAWYAAAKAVRLSDKVKESRFLDPVYYSKWLINGFCHSALNVGYWGQNEKYVDLN